MYFPTKKTVLWVNKIDGISINQQNQYIPLMNRL